MPSSASSPERLEGVIVGVVDVGEADRIARLLSPERGRCDVMVRRARTSRRRFAGLLDAGNRVELRLGRSKGPLPLVAEGRLVQGPRRAREDVERLGLLAYGCELCAALAPEHHPAPRLHRLLCVWLDQLEAEVAPGVAGRLALEAKALTFAGLAPALARCSRCGLPLEGAAVFDAEEGGAMHDRCGGGVPLAARTALYLEALRRTPLAETAALPPPDEGRWLLADFAEHHLARGLRSRAFLEDIEATG